MKRVYITQYFCPQRHCVIAGVFEADETDLDGLTEQAVSGILKQMNERQINPWCAICGSKDLKFETARTCFASIEEAASPLAELETQQMITNILLKRF